MYFIREYNKKFQIVEKSTDNVIMSSFDRKNISKYLKHLMMGYGFNGFTPDFFTKEYVLNFSAD